METNSCTRDSSNSLASRGCSQSYGRSSLPELHGSHTVPFKRNNNSASGWTWRDTFYLLALLLLALVLRTVNLDTPSKMYFDEIYYVDAAEELWQGKPDPNSVHPPLGKWIIAVGIDVTTRIAPEVSQAVTWRAASVLAGILMVAATYSMSLMLYQYNRVAAGLFVATEHLHLSMTRIAMLDPFLALFCLLGTWWSFAYFLGGHERWALLGALSFGLATGCKWSGLLSAFGCFLACLFLDRYYNLDEINWHKSQRYFFWCLLLVPLGFFLSYFHLFMLNGFSAETFQTIFGQGERMVKFRYNPEEFVHGYKSYFWDWPLVLRPIWIFFEQENSKVVGICSLGVWTTWWAFTALMIERAYVGIVQKRDLVGGALVLVWLGQWLPWAASTTGGFFYYMLPQVPIMGLLMGKWFADLANFDDVLGEGRWRGWLLATVYLAGFALYFPFATGIEVSRKYFDLLFFLPHWI